MSDDEAEFDVYYSKERDGVLLLLHDSGTVLDIKDAVYLRHQLDLAISDYVKAAGR